MANAAHGTTCDKKQMVRPSWHRRFCGKKRCHEARTTGAVTVEESSKSNCVYNTRSTNVIKNAGKYTGRPRNPQNRYMQTSCSIASPAALLRQPPNTPQNSDKEKESCSVLIWRRCLFYADYPCLLYPAFSILTSFKRTLRPWHPYKLWYTF